MDDADGGNKEKTDYTGVKKAASHIISHEMV